MSIPGSARLMRTSPTQHVYCYGVSLSPLYPTVCLEDFYRAAKVTNPAVLFCL